jgi:protein O-mannosyl-transferase
VTLIDSAAVQSESPSRPAAASARRTDALLLAGVALLALVVYANALRNGYAIDDETIVMRNPVVHGFGRLHDLLLGPYWQKSGDLYRPVTLFTFALDHTLFGASTAAMHAVNVVLHAVAAVLVVLLVRRLGGGAVPAALAGAVFAVHPVHVEAVANLVGRAEVLATLCVLLACQVYLGGSPRSTGRIAAISALYLLGLGSKEIAVTLPGLLLVLDALRRTGEREGPWRILVRNLPLMAALTATLVVYLLLRMQANGALLGLPPAPYFFGISTAQRLATAAALVPEYVRLLLWPRDLSADWGPDLLRVVGWSSPHAWLGVAITIAAAALAVVSWRRARWTAAAVLWIALAIFPVSSLPFPAGTMLAERNLYLASVGLGFLLPPLAAAVARERRVVQMATAVGLGLLLVLGVARTWTRTPVWRSSGTVFQAMVGEHPELWWVDWKAAVILVQRGRPEESIPWFQRALRKTKANGISVDLDYVNTMHNLGRFGETEPLLRHMVAAYPRSVPAYLELAALCVDQARHAEALALIDRAARIPRWGPKSIVEIRNRRAIALDGLGRLDEALAERRATLRDPTVRTSGPAWYHYARLLQERGDTVAARQALDSARVRTDPHLRDLVVLHPLPSLRNALVTGWGPLITPPAARPVTNASSSPTAR